MIAWQQVVGYGCEALLAALAVAVSVRRAYHRPFAAYAILRAVVDPAHALLQAMRGSTVHPLDGVERIVYHLCVGSVQVLVLAVAVLCATVFAPRVRQNMLCLCGAVVVLTVLTYPASAGRVGIMTAQVAGVVGGWVCIEGWLRKEHTWTSRTALLTLLFLATETTVLGGPFAHRGSLTEWWALAWSAYLTAHIAALAIHAAWLADINSDDQPRRV